MWWSKLKQRKELEKSGDVKKFITSIDTLGREQPRQRKPVVSVFNPTKREERAVREKLPKRKTSGRNFQDVECSGLQWLTDP